MRSCYGGVFLLILLALSSPSMFAVDSKDGSNPASEIDDVDLVRATVRIYATPIYPEIFKPWLRRPGIESSGTGFSVAGKRILTSAHLVAWATDIQVQTGPGAEKIPAYVEFISPNLDLAVLTVDDETFFENHPPLAFSEILPGPSKTIEIEGFPTNGLSLAPQSLTVTEVSFANFNGLHIKTDAVINAGNSGAPVLFNHRLIGVATVAPFKKDQPAFIISAEEVDHFLTEVATGSNEGKDIFDYGYLQTFENGALSGFLKAGAGHRGMIVTKPESDDPAYPLKKWDVITHIGGTPVDERGQVAITGGYSVHFTYLVQKAAKAGLLPLTIFREGKEINVAVPVTKSSRSRLLRELNREYPPYFILGPLVFTTATPELVTAMLAQSATAQMMSISGSPLITRRNEKPAFAGEELVVVPAPFFSSPLAKGYSQPAGYVVSSVNGIKVKNLAHLVEILRDSREEYLSFEFGGRNEMLVFPRKAMIDQTDAILTANSVYSQGSSHLLAIWNAHQANH